MIFKSGLCAGQRQKSNTSKKKYVLSLQLEMKVHYPAER